MNRHRGPLMPLRTRPRAPGRVGDGRKVDLAVPSETRTCFRLPPGPPRRPGRSPVDPCRVRGVRQDAAVAGRADARLGGPQAPALRVPVAEGREPPDTPRSSRPRSPGSGPSCWSCRRPWRHTGSGGSIDPEDLVAARMALKHAPYPRRSATTFRTWRGIRRGCLFPSWAFRACQWCCWGRRPWCSYRGR